MDREQLIGKSRGLARKLVTGTARNIKEGRLTVGFASAFLRSTDAVGIIERGMRSSILPEEFTGDTSWLKSAARRVRTRLKRVVESYSATPLSWQTESPEASEKR